MGWEGEAEAGSCTHSQARKSGSGRGATAVSRTLASQGPPCSPKAGLLGAAGSFLFPRMRKGTCVLSL